MNDSELDEILNGWEAPAPPPSLRAGLRARFPRAERRRFGRPLRWLLMAAVASVALAVAMEQSGGSLSDSRVIQLLGQIWDHVTEVIEVHRVMAIVNRISQSEPMVYVDGVPGASLTHRYANVMSLEIPGERPYLITFWTRRLNAWKEAGRVHGNTVEFQAGAHQVRVECSAPLTDSDVPVFVRTAEPFSH